MCRVCRIIKRLFVVSCLVLFLLNMPATAQTHYRLPSMGDPADQDLSPQREREIGAAYLRYIRANLQLVSDPFLQEYLDSLGERLLGHTANVNFDFHFFIIDEAIINAVAAPGGYIGINSGLWLAAETEAQLAGVVAHEIAHVVQRHLARAQAAAKTSSASAAAAILAAILLSGNNPQAGQAILAAGVAGGQQLQINYTRENEREADRVGIGILAKAGFDPAGMAEFFQILDRQYGRDNESLLEFLQTHPLTNERIAEAENRALSLRHDEQIQDGHHFQLARMRLRVLTHPALPQLQQILAAHNSKSTAEAYGLALTYFQLRDFKSALEIIEPLAAQTTDNLYYSHLLANIYYALDQPQRGQTIFERLLQLYPDHGPTLHSYALALENSGEHPRAYGLLQQAMRQTEMQQAEHYRALARISDKAGQKITSLEALAEYHALSGSPRLAIEQLEQALRQLKPESNSHQRLSARLTELRQDYADQLKNNQR